MEKSSNPESKRVTRIKIILEREHITQKDLADRLVDPHDPKKSMEPQNLSRMMKTGKITEKTCQRIIAAFPEYRLDWLMGFDDYMTFEDWIDSTHHQQDVVAQGIWGMIEKSLSKQGKSLRFVHRQDQHVHAYQRAHADCYYTIVDQDGAVLKTLTAVELIQFEKQLQEYCDFLTDRHLLK